MVDNEKLAILFADVVGSTKLYELMGDAKARETVLQCLDAMRRATEEHGGRVVKTMGDEVMATFSEVDSAAAAACAMHRLISEEGQVDEVPVAIRVGFHFGPVMLEDGDVFGGAVHIANRMTTQAKAAQILTTGESIARMSDDWKKNTRQVDIATVRGKTDEVEMYEVLWLSEGHTRMMPALQLRETPATPQKLTLRYRGTELVVDESRPNISIGRSDASDLIVKDSLISRFHARIEFQRGKFILVDQSTNGTCLLQSNGDESFIRRDSVQISGRGSIGLGRVPQADSPQAIHFKHED